MINLYRVAGATDIAGKSICCNFESSGEIRLGKNIAKIKRNCKFLIIAWKFNIKIIKRDLKRCGTFLKCATPESILSRQNNHLSSGLVLWRFQRIKQNTLCGQCRAWNAHLLYSFIEIGRLLQK